ncbi:hypothetical protein PI125_g13920 [Phytophthora idaei]|nr:hypothetical protein PI125_g13920 [Phytophthora idaei]
MMYRVLEIVSPVLNKAFICPPSMAAQRANSSTFRHNPYALYTTDVKFQPAFRHTGRFSEAKHYFSNKHKLYGLKVEVSVAFPGRVVFLTNHTPGSVSDITTVANHLKDHQRLLEKTNQERLIEDNGEDSEQYQEAWAILADKGYQGGASMLGVAHPKKKPRNGELTADELARNARVSSDRVLIENFFGRVCLLWKITHSTYKWNEASFDSFTRTCFALTNFHGNINPLRVDDGRFYRSVMGRYASRADRERTKRASIQRRYRRRRDARIAEDQNIRTRLSFSPSFSP